jgi:hypothetical protein
MPANEFGHDRGQSVNLVECIAIFDRNILPLDVARGFKTSFESCHELSRIFGGRYSDQTNYRHRLLCMRRQRASSRPAQPGDERAPIRDIDGHRDFPPVTMPS